MIYLVIDVFFKLYCAVMLFQIMRLTKKELKYTSVPSSNLLYASFIETAIAYILILSISVIHLFVEIIPLYILIPISLAIYFLQILALLNSVLFTSKAFYKRAKPIVSILLYMIAGGFIGMLFATIFVKEPWDQVGNPPLSFMSMFLLLIIGLSSMILYFAKSSAKVERLWEAKKSMNRYASGVGYFLLSVILITLFGILIPNAGDTIDFWINSSLYIITPICNLFMLQGGLRQRKYIQKIRQKENRENYWENKLIERGIIR